MAVAQPPPPTRRDDTPAGPAERYRVPAAGALVLDLSAGDRFRVTDPEGRQPCDVAAFGPAGRPAPDAVSAAAGAERVAADWGDRAGPVVEALSRRGVTDVAGAAAVRLLAADTAAGASADAEVTAAVVCVLSAPGGRLPVGGGLPATELAVDVWRKVPREASVPPPLAEPRLDFRVDRQTARAYEVTAGEWVQVIDVSGRQCSDFLAFDAARLAAGVERGIDPTATRTLMGNAHPTPGLYAKFFDQDFRPLAEVVQDTVGRHDTFALACTAKYYADKGYPGHPNCTDNFNAALAPHGVAPRAGWPAVNFFYNTAFDHAHHLVLDEPWSRPGDYVLLRALADLVCATSACPDDIDPANGWDPTDVHVRVYPADCSFPRAVVYRSPGAEPRMTRETGFHPRTAALTREFVAYNGYWLPAAFPGYGPAAEYVGCRERAAVVDLSALRKFEVLGPDAEALMQAAVPRDVRKLAPGQVVYTALCHDTGGVLDDGTVFRLGADNFRWVCGTDAAGAWLRALSARRNLRAWVKTATDDLHNLAVQGPASRDLLRPLVWAPPTQPSLDELTWFRFTVGRLGGPTGVPVVVSRTGYTGELGYELWCHPSDAAAVWDLVWAAGRPHGLVPLGLTALECLRIEAGLAAAGREFDDLTDPFEAGIGFTVARTKADDYVGKAALAKRAANPQRVLVGLELDGNEPAGHGDPVRVGPARVGVVTSGTRSPVLGKNIALCRLAVEYAEPGTRVDVTKLDGQLKVLPATVVPTPFYDPQKKRPRS